MSAGSVRQRFTPAQDIVLGKVALHAQEGCWRSRDALWRVTGAALTGIACRRAQPFAWMVSYDDAEQEAWLMFETLLHRWEPRAEDGTGFVGFVFVGFGYRMMARYRVLVGRDWQSGVPLDGERGRSWLVQGRQVRQEGGPIGPGYYGGVEFGLVMTGFIEGCGTFDRALLRGVLSGAGSAVEIGRWLGISDRTTRRRWAALREDFRNYLEGAMDETTAD